MAPARLIDVMPGARGTRMTPQQRDWLRTRLGDAHIGIAGVTGAVGREMLALLEEVRIPKSGIIATGSSRSLGTRIPYADDEIIVESAESLRATECVLLATPSSVSRALMPMLIECGMKISDTSSAFRSQVPLIIPEINAASINLTDRIVASPNCTTTIALTAVEGIRKRFGFCSLEIVSYQAVSGAGTEAMHALLDETRDIVNDGVTQARWLDEQIAFNVFPHESAVDPATGLCIEEQKFIDESSRILNSSEIETAATCMRVPSLRTHTVAIRIESVLACDRVSITNALRSTPGVNFVESGPSSLAATATCSILAGPPVVQPTNARNGSTIRLIVAGDQLLKGAAWNALQNLALLRSTSRRQQIE